MDGEVFVYVHPIRSKSQSGESLNGVTRNIGVLNTLIPDNVGEQTGTQTDLQECIRLCHIDGRTMEPYYPCQNRSKGMIKIIKDKAKRRIILSRVTKRIWDFSLVWEEEIYSRKAGKYGRAPMERFTVDIINISEWTEFDFYDLYWYWDNQTDKTDTHMIKHSREAQESWSIGRTFTQIQ